MYHFLAQCDYLLHQKLFEASKEIALCSKPSIIAFFPSKIAVAMPRYSKNRFGPILALIENEVDIQATLVKKHSKEHCAFKWNSLHGLQMAWNLGNHGVPRHVTSFSGIMGRITLATQISRPGVRDTLSHTFPIFQNGPLECQMIELGR